MNFELLYEELEETIELESEDVEKLLSVVESKRQRISDCLRVMEALLEGGFVEDCNFTRRE